jgi:hypothetical protein
MSLVLFYTNYLHVHKLIKSAKEPLRMAIKDPNMLSSNIINTKSN